MGRVQRRVDGAKEEAMRKSPAVAVVAMLLASPVAAQGVIGGAEQGAREGSAVGGPVGGVVGGAVGGAVGGVTGVVTGLLGVDQAPRFRDYVVREGRSAYRIKEDVRRGMILPKEKITFYEVPREFGVSSRFRYTIVNDHIVLVNPRTRQVVQVID
jgi:hypothetical protein